MPVIDSTLVSSTGRQLVFEIERKFLPNATSIAALRDNAGYPPFRKIIPQKRRQFQDIYYDHENILSSRGIWVRRRSDTWQAKVRRGGDFKNSRFQELSGIDDVSEVVLDHVPEAYVSIGRIRGLEEIARFITFRESWRVNDRFTVVIDEADFGHTVGEVELMHSMESAEGATGLNGISASEKLDVEIREFMRVHEWAFPTGDLSGKLSAYFALKRRS